MNEREGVGDLLLDPIDFRMNECQKIQETETRFILIVNRPYVNVKCFCNVIETNVA